MGLLSTLHTDVEVLYYLHLSSAAIACSFVYMKFQVQKVITIVFYRLWDCLSYWIALNNDAQSNLFQVRLVSSFNYNDSFITGSFDIGSPLQPRYLLCITNRIGNFQPI